MPMGLHFEQTVDGMKRLSDDEKGSVFHSMCVIGWKKVLYDSFVCLFRYIMI